MKKQRVVIAGGGLAGLTCAKRLIDAGHSVELLEAMSVFGGRATSWKAPGDGEIVESGLHAFFAIYDRLSGLLKEVGVDRDTMVTWTGSVAYMGEGGRYYTFGIDPLRALPRVLWGLLANQSLVDLGGKINLAETGVRSLLLRLFGSKGEVVATVAQRAGLDTKTLNRVLRPLTRSLFFLEPEELTSRALIDLGLHMAARPTEIRAGVFKGPMGEVMIKPITDWLSSHDATLRLSTAVESLDFDAATNLLSTVTLQSGEKLQADVFVSALPLHVLQRLIPDSLRQEPYFSAITKIPSVPAVSVQMWFDQRVLDCELFLFLPQSSVPIFQDQSLITFSRQGSRISCQVTDRTTDGFSDEQYIALAVSELGRFLPRLKNMKPQRLEVVRHKAFASSTEVVYKLRPSQITPVPNFFICGDYTRQDWYTTMEGATRSGELAAEKIIALQQGNKLEGWRVGLSD